MKMDVVIAGVGGQGNLFASEIISRYAIATGMNVLGTESIGASQRGGSVTSHIRISLGQIFSPLVPIGEADFLIGLEPIEMLRHFDRLSPDGMYLVNQYKIPTVMSNMGLDRYPNEEEINAALEFYAVPGYALEATRMALEIGDAILANVIMLGALCALSSFFDDQRMRAALVETSPEQAREINAEAYEVGYSLITFRGAG